MKRKDIDWKIIRGSLISVILSLIISSALVAGSFYFRDEMRKDFNRNDALFKNISQLYLAIDEEKKRIQKYYPEFIKLHARGLIGNEQRLNWIEVLRAAGIDIKLPSLNYSITSQKIHTPAFSVNLGRFSLYKSEMSLDMQLLHEGDLFRMLDALNDKAKGIYTLTSCNFDSPGKEIIEDPAVGNIRASCELEWYTLKLATGEEIMFNDTGS